jgi:hypothetical protein
MAGGLGLVSGDYGDGMLIGFDPATQRVSGYVSSQTGEGRFSCIFALTGRPRGSSAAISTAFPETPKADRIDGQLLLRTPQSFRVRLPTEHGGCWNVEHFADDSQPAEFSLQAPHPWISIAVVRRDKAYLFDSPASATHRKAYVVKGDGVGVRAVRPGWLQVDFAGGGRLVSGWVCQGDVYPTD